MDGDFVDDEPAPAPRRAAPKVRPAPAVKAKAGEGSLLEPFLRNQAFQDLVRDKVLEVLRSPEGQDIVARAVRRELDRR